MNKNRIQEVSQIFGKVATKIAESALHAAIFAFVSKKVTTLMSRNEDCKKSKVRVDEEPTAESVISTEQV